MMGLMRSLREKWRRGEPVVGGWLSIPSTVTAETMARAGFDYLCVDNQHGAFDYAQTVPALQVIGSGDSVPLVRVPWNEPGVIAKMLDAGAHAVIVPMVNSAPEAVAAVRACRYHPEGARSYGPTLVGPRHGDYFAFAVEEVACIPMIETAEALAQLGEICEVPGVDTIYVGPADLSVSLGLPPGNNDDDPRFLESLEHVVATCARHGVVAGIHATPDLVQRRAEMGFRMVTATSDLGALRSGLGTARGDSLYG